MYNAAHVRRLTRAIREDLSCRDFRMLDFTDQKRRAEARMILQDRMIAQGSGLAGRVSADMLRAGPLKTDEWALPPSSPGVGRRLNRLSDIELEAQEFGRWSS